MLAHTWLKSKLNTFMKEGKREKEEKREMHQMHAAAKGEKQEHYVAFVPLLLSTN